MEDPTRRSGNKATGATSKSGLGRGGGVCVCLRVCDRMDGVLEYRGFGGCVCLCVCDRVDGILECRGFGGSVKRVHLESQTKRDLTGRGRRDRSLEDEVEVPGLRV